MKLYVEKGLNFGPMIVFSTLTMLQLTWHSLWSSFWPKNHYKNGTLILFPWFYSKWLVAMSKNKMYALKGRRFQDIGDIKKMWCHWKLLHGRSSRNVSDIGSVIGL